MLRLHSDAPRFDCKVVRDGEVTQLDWDELQEQQKLVLLFESLGDFADREEEVARLGAAATRLSTLHTRLAVVCRDHEMEILTWMQCWWEELASQPLEFPVIADADYHISSLYDMLSVEGPLWGQVITDAEGRVRSVAEYSFPVELNVDELVHTVASIVDSKQW